MWFDDLASVKGFMGDDYDLAHVPPAAQAMPVPVRPAVVPL
jgi:hypothetical protein